MAFVSAATTTSFTGQRSIARSSTTALPSSSQSVGKTNRNHGPARVTMKYSPMDAMLSKYEELRTSGDVAPIPSTPSSIWTKYVNETRDKMMTQYVTSDPVASQSYAEFMLGVRRMARMFVSPGVAPVASTADSYVADTVTRQYKRAAACSTGVYTVACTEGAVKLQAEESRVASLARDFRTRKQASASAAYGALYDRRRRAIIAAHECSYEEYLIVKFPVAAAPATVSSGAEGIGACARSAVGDFESGEDYMIKSVERQCKMQAVPYGVYTKACADGSVKNMAEYGRVVGLAAKFRSGQISDIGREQRDFDRRKYARENFAHMCSYEEDLFNKYPAMAAAMSGKGASY